VLISGVSGAGKTTVATALERSLGLPRYELDALYHGPNWVKRPEFEAEVAAFAAEPRWVTEDQYHRVLGDLLWQYADTLVWLDLPRSTVMRQVIRRSLVRAVTRRELCSGNRESFRDWLSPDHPIRWAWQQHTRKHRDAARRIAEHPEVTMIRLTSARAARRWCAAPQNATARTTDPH
jgi:adenylate kinase family enzyme